MSRAKCYARLRPSAIPQWEQGKHTGSMRSQVLHRDALLPNIVRRRTFLHGQAYFGLIWGNAHSSPAQQIF